MTESSPSIRQPSGRRRTIAWVAGILGLGLGVFAILVATKPRPEEKVEPGKPLVVDVEEVAEESRPVMVTAMGTVVPARSVIMTPEVSGRLVYQSPALVPGGRFAKGQILARIDPRDYDLAVRQQKAAVAQAELALVQERSLKKVADREWSLIADEVQPTDEGRQLALREIQLEVAHAAADAARARLEQAELQRERTALRAPFNAIVVEEHVDVGQVVSPTTAVATLADSDRYWVRVSLPSDQLKWVRIPGLNGKKGSDVTVQVKLGGNETVEHRGTVVQLYPDLDPKGMMARLLVQVDQPLSGAGLPLLLGSFATVKIRGAALEKVASIPRAALHDNNRVWVMGADETLQFRRVDVVWSEAERVFVSGDLKPGDRAVISRIAVPVEGMTIRLNGHQPARPDDEEDAPGSQKSADEDASAAAQGTLPAQAGEPEEPASPEADATPEEREL